MSEQPSPDDCKGYPVFFSYSRRDIGIAKLLIEKMTGQVSGIKVFLDERSIEGGDPIKETIRENIKGCKELLVLLSAYSVKSTWVGIELSAAWALERRIVAIVYDVTPKDGLPIIADLEAIKLENFNDYLMQLAERAKEGQE